MTRNRTRRGTAVTAMLGTALLGATVLGGAVLGGGAASAVESTEADRHAVPQEASAGDGWSAERMEAAIPGEALVAGKLDQPIGAAATGTLDVPAEAADPAVTPFATRESPVPHIGKVFFSLGGSDYVCSGNAVASANESTVATAGHCLNSGPGAFATEFVFVPAYENGRAPYGQWAATDLVAPTQWTRDGDITYDTGFAVVSSPSGASLTDTVGASGVAFDEGRGKAYRAYGYPAGAPFDGQTLQSCLGTATADPYGQSESQGIPCDMTGGSSGGPWFIGGNADGRQNSVNSFGYDNVPDTMFGPYWGSVIQGAYQSASA